MKEITTEKEAKDFFLNNSSGNCLVVCGDGVAREADNFATAVMFIKTNDQVKCSHPKGFKPAQTKIETPSLDSTYKTVKAVYCPDCLKTASLYF